MDVFIPVGGNRVKETIVVNHIGEQNVFLRTPRMLTHKNGRQARKEC
jgi:hypothetical protein